MLTNSRGVAVVTLARLQSTLAPRRLTVIERAGQTLVGACAVT